MRKGFSLVEIMVVVVILGVLAGVGVPKLFGVIAKARASEVPVAAGTYVSLQNAYLHENNGIGSWKNIGYGAPGNGQTEYFDYSGCINGTIVFDQMEPDMPGWQATSRAGLNSCVTGSAWAVVIDPAGEREIDYRKIISSPECAALTTSWGVVGETVEGMCETTGELHVAGTENKTPEKPETPTETPAEDPSDPEPSAPTSADNSNSEEGSSSAVDCAAIAASGHSSDPRVINGNKCGWCYVQECRLAVNKGHSGLSVDECVRLCDYEKTHNIDKEIKEYEEEQKRKEQEQQEAQNQNQNQNQNTSGGGGSGGGSGGSGSGPTQIVQPTNPVTEGVSIEGSEEDENDDEGSLIVDQNGHPFDMKDLPETITYCDEFTGSGSCKNKHSSSINKSKCAKYDTSKNLCIEIAN